MITTVGFGDVPEIVKYQFIQFGEVGKEKSSLRRWTLIMLLSYRVDRVIGL